VLLPAYGLLVDCDIPLPGLHVPQVSAPWQRLTAQLVDPGDVVPVWSGPADPVARVSRAVDARDLVYERGAGGDLLMTWGAGEGVFHLDVERRLLRCASAEPGPPGARWRRVLLDSILVSTALALGADALHAGAVRIGGRAVAIAAGTSAGKTSLVVELVGRGHALVCDDILVLVPRGGEAPDAHPAPAMLSVARDGPAGATAGALGTTMADLDDEHWMTIERVADSPCPLGAVVLLDRRPGATLAAERAEPDPLPLLGHLLDSGSAPGRRAQRFELAGDIADRVALLRLAAPSEAPPSVLAAELESALARTGVGVEAGG
jgi:hypothetical protein